MSRLAQRSVAVADTLNMGVGVSARQLGLAWEGHYHVRGSVPAGPRLAVVGSRACDFGLADAVAPIVAAAHDLGWSVVSGGALGIDARAHREALARAVPQLAVLPCASDAYYPPRNAELFDRIAAAPASGLLFALGESRPPCRGIFASRNRIVVGLATALVVVQAGARSGSAGTGRLGLSTATPTAVLPGSRGCAALAAAGAFRLPDATDAQLGSTVRRWLEAVLEGRTLADQGGAWPPRLTWLREAIAARGARGLNLDALPDPLAGVVALTEAETLGLITELAPGRYVLARS